VRPGNLAGWRDLVADGLPRAIVRSLTTSDDTRIAMPDLRRPLPPLLLAGLLLTACATPEVDTPRDDELGGTPDLDAADEGTDPDPGDPDPGDPDPGVDETQPDDGEAEGQRQEDVFEGETLTDADITSRLSPLGTHVVDGQGRTLYVFTEDPDGERTCTGECLRTWPIFSTGDELPTVDGEVREELVGTTAGEGGGRQVTYNDQPLYYYEGDDAVGDLEGHGLAGEWFAVTPEGPPIEDAVGDS
jgi:predicted lipoprotein with Yx(FWY)xxD motif